MYKIGYKGVWMYELDYKNPLGVTRSRDLTYEDVYKNAKTLFEEKQPEPFGKRNSEIPLGYFPVCE